MTTPTIELKPSSHPLSEEEREAILRNPGFGRHFTDHMVTVKWTEGAAGTTPSWCPTPRSRSTPRT